MSLSQKFWKKRIAPSLVALVASAGTAAWADDSDGFAAPGQLIVIGATSPITPEGRHDDDPPPAPPVDVAPSSGPTARRGAADAPSTAMPAVPQASDITPTPPPDPAAEYGFDEFDGSGVDAGAPLADGQAPNPLPGDNLDAQGLAPPPADQADNIPDVRISAPIPAEAPDSELVQERFPNGSLKIAREVTQDGHGNFINHGSWKEWNIQGELIAEGEFRRGARHGAWRRVLRANESPLFSTTPYSQYKGPFVSEVNLNEGRLEGVWTISDAQGHKISEIEFAQGQRHGVSSWWHANSRKMQQITFRNGVAVDEILTWRADGSLAAKEEFRDGRKIEAKTEYYAQNRLKSQGDYLSPKMIASTPDDWWNCRLATFKPEGEPVRHGAWTAWHANGQEQVEGHFENGRPVGEFTWYHPNGQQSVEGSYQNGERHGVWTWWHENGLKAATGDFNEGKPAGKWTWWNNDGKVAQKADFADGVPVQALQQQLPQVKNPKLMNPKQASRPAPFRQP